MTQTGTIEYLNSPKMLIWERRDQSLGIFWWRYLLGKCLPPLSCFILLSFNGSFPLSLYHGYA